MKRVSPTRVNLLNLKKELKVARKGYRLLKDKRDGLVQTFMDVVYKTREKREKINKDLPQAFTSYVGASASIARKVHDIAFLIPKTKVDIDVKKKAVMSVPIPKFSLSMERKGFSYGMMGTSGELDNAISKMEEILPDLIELAELEKTLENLAEEIEKTRRRTNALEHIKIPEIEKSIHFINQRLEEQSRDAVVNTMRVKAMIIEKERAERV